MKTGNGEKARLDLSQDIKIQLFKKHKQVVTFQLVSFRCAGRQILLPFGRTQVSCVHVFILC